MFQLSVFNESLVIVDTANEKQMFSASTYIYFQLSIREPLHVVCSTVFKSLNRFSALNAGAAYKPNFFCGELKHRCHNQAVEKHVNVVTQALEKFKTFSLQLEVSLSQGYVNLYATFDLNKSSKSRFKL